MSDRLDGSNHAQIIHAPNVLREKVGPGTGIEPERIRRADEAIAERADDFIERMRLEVDRLDALISDLDDAANATASGQIQGEIYALVHEMRGEAGSYGYSIMSWIANLLCNYLEQLPQKGVARPLVVRPHSDALAAILRGDIKGDGGEVGRELVGSLRILNAQQRQ